MWWTYGNHQGKFSMVSARQLSPGSQVTEAKMLHRNVPLFHGMVKRPCPKASRRHAITEYPGGLRTTGGMEVHLLAGTTKQVVNSGRGHVLGVPQIRRWFQRVTSLVKHMG